MKEQSHKDEMSAALRGDFARLRGRGVAATLAPREDDTPQPAAVDLTEPEPPGDEPERETPEPEAEAETGLPDAEQPVAQPGFFARMLGR